MLCEAMLADVSAYRPDFRWQDDFSVLETRVWEAIDAR